MNIVIASVCARDMVATIRRLTHADFGRTARLRNAQSITRPRVVIVETPPPLHGHSIQWVLACPLLTTHTHVDERVYRWARVCVRVDGYEMDTRYPEYHSRTHPIYQIRVYSASVS